MNSQLKVMFNHENTNITEFISIKEKKIPIFNVEENLDKKRRLEYTEKFMRIHEKCMDDVSRTFLANYIYHEMDGYMGYNEFSRKLNQKFSFYQDIKIITSGWGDPLLNKIRGMDEKAIVVELPGKEDESIYLLAEQEDSYLPSLEALLTQRYNENVRAIQNFSSKEKESYCEAEELAKTIENTRNLNEWDKAAAVLMLCFPRHIKVIHKEIVKRDLWKETAISRIYHENSKLRTFHQQGDFMLPLDKIDEEVKKLTAQGRKKYPQSYQRIKLPSADRSSRYSLEEAVLQRRSRRHYSKAGVSIQKLSNILYYSYGITGKLEKTDLLLRAVPSGGGLYPIDIYISVNRVEGLEKGIYYYDSLEHELVFVNHNDLSEISKEVSGYAAMLDTAAFTFILGANFWRNQWKYHERGYRVILIDCGHVAQNLHMMSTAYDLGSCCLMGFVDDELNKLLGLDGIVEHSMYLITVGVNREE